MSMNVSVIIVLNILNSFFYCKYKHFPAIVTRENPYSYKRNPYDLQNRWIQPDLFAICQLEVTKVTGFWDRFAHVRTPKRISNYTWLLEPCIFTPP